MSIAAIQPPVAIYHEEQRFGWWIYVMLAVIFLGAWGLFLKRTGPLPNMDMAKGVLLEIPAVIMVGFGFPIFLVLFVLRLTTEVTPTQIRIWFGWIPTYRRGIPIASISRVEVVQFSPLRDHRGWGITMGRDGERGFTARGNRGVRLFLLDGRTILIGSQRPEELASAVEGALRPNV